jgi:hypothetical protein
MLRIRQDQVAPFEQDAIGKFVRRAIAHLRTELPDRVRGKSDRGLGRKDARLRILARTPYHINDPGRRSKEIARRLRVDA